MDREQTDRWKYIRAFTGTVRCDPMIWHS